MDSVASMGPRLWDADDRFSVVSTTIARALQWGRVFGTRMTARIRSGWCNGSCGPECEG